jgi:hypothetical protein
MRGASRTSFALVRSAILSLLAVSFAAAACGGGSSTSSDVRSGADASSLDGSQGTDGSGTSDGAAMDGTIDAGGMDATIHKDATVGPDGSVDIPNSTDGIPFADLRFSSGLRKVIAPVPTQGSVALIDPDSLAVTEISGFGKVASVDEGRGFIFGVERAAGMMHVADPLLGGVVASVNTTAMPEYVRYVAPTHEVWVTEPTANQIEIFTVPTMGTPTPAPAGTVMIMGGLTGLTIDNTHAIAFTQVTSAMGMLLSNIDVNQRMETARWYSGCSSPGGPPVVDEMRNVVLAGCGMARVVALNAGMMGQPTGSLPLDANPSALSILAYAPMLGHVYLRGDPGMPVAMVGVSNNGALSMLGEVFAETAGKCMTADDRGYLWVCDSAHGRLLRFNDTYPASH